MSGPRRLLFFVLALLGAAVLAPSTAPSTARALDAAPPQVTVLANGLTVATRERPDAELVSVAVAVRVGGRDEPASLRGGSHLLEHLHFLGAERHPTTSALFATIAGVGGDMNARTGNETTTYYATVPAARFGVAVDVLADMLQRPLFPADAAERERGVVQEELRGQSRAMLSAALDTLSAALIGSAGQDPGGTVDTVGAIDLAELLRYRAERYTARNMVLAVVGPVRHAEVVAAVEAAFAQLPSGRRMPPAALPPPQDSLRLDGVSPSGAIVVVGQRIPGMDSPDRAALWVMDGILDGPGTRMADALDARGGTRLIQLGDTGIWAAFADTSPANADAVLEVVRDQVRRLQDEPVGAEELQATKRFLAGRVRLGGDSITAQAVRLAELSVLGVYESEDDFAARILAVTADDVQRVARAYLQPETFSVAALARRSRSSN